MLTFQSETMQEDWIIITQILRIKVIPEIQEVAVTQEILELQVVPAIQERHNSAFPGGSVSGTNSGKTDGNDGKADNVSKYESDTSGSNLLV